jgi:nicotinamidase/pyrazinamidase
MMPGHRLEPSRTLFYDVDTQRDFMLAGGALYVSGCETIIPALAELSDFARRLHIRRFCSVDRHFPGDAELRRNGGPWPDHCMDGTPGQRKIDETAAANARALPNTPLAEVELERALQQSGDLILEKQDVDVLKGNRLARQIIAWLAAHYDCIAVYGVFTEVCVDYAVQALLQAGKTPVVVNDAIYDIDLAAGEAARHRWQAEGVELITHRALQERLLSSSDRK